MRTSLKNLSCSIAVAAAISTVSSIALADTYEVSITNATQGQAFTPRGESYDTAIDMVNFSYIARVGLSTESVGIMFFY